MQHISLVCFVALSCYVAADTQAANPLPVTPGSRLPPRPTGNVTDGPKFVPMACEWGYLPFSERSAAKYNNASLSEQELKKFDPTVTAAACRSKSDPIGGLCDIHSCQGSTTGLNCFLLSADPNTKAVSKSPTPVSTVNCQGLLMYNETKVDESLCADDKKNPYSCSSFQGAATCNTCVMANDPYLKKGEGAGGDSDTTDVPAGADTNTTASSNSASS